MQKINGISLAACNIRLAYAETLPVSSFPDSCAGRSQGPFPILGEALPQSGSPGCRHTSVHRTAATAALSVCTSIRRLDPWPKLLPGQPRAPRFGAPQRKNGAVGGLPGEPAGGPHIRVRRGNDSMRQGARLVCPTGGRQRSRSDAVGRPS